jgi:hypothetical protein
VLVIVSVPCDPPLELLLVDELLLEEVPPDEELPLEEELLLPLEDEEAPLDDDELVDDELLVELELDAVLPSLLSPPLPQAPSVRHDRQAVSTWKVVRMQRL